MIQLITPALDVANNSSKRPKLSKPPIALTVLLLLTLTICFLAGPQGNFPANDDRIYAECVNNLVSKGKFLIEVSNAYDFVPIIAAAAFCKIVGFSYEALRWTTIAFHLLGVTGLYLAIRQWKIPQTGAALISSVYALNPFLINLSLSFMSDVPSLALANWSLFALISGIKKPKFWSFFLAILFITAAAATRQTCLVLLPVIVLCAIQSLRKWPDKLLICASTLIPVLSHICLHFFMMVSQKSIASYSDYSKLMAASLGIFTSPFACLELIAKGSCYIGLFLLPLTIVFFLKALTENSRARNCAIVVALIATCIPLAWMQSKGSFMPYSLNLFIPPILGSYTIIGGTPIWSAQHIKEFTYICDAVAFLSVFCLLFSLFSNLVSAPRNTDNAVENTLLISTEFFITVGLILQIATSNFDRYYLLALGPLILCLVPLWRKFELKKLQILTATISVAIGAYAFLAAADVMNFGRAQWQAIELLEQSGVRPEQIDGGAMHSIHRLKHAIFGATFRQNIGWPERVRGGKERWHLRWWPILGEDYIISTIGLPGYHKVAEVRYFSTLAFRQRHIFVLASDSLKN